MNRADFITQGVKLRSLTSTGQVISKKPHAVLWAVPQPPTKQIRFHRPRHPTIATRLSRMVPVHCNHPNTTGYSICWDIRILATHAHKTNEDLAFYTSDMVKQERAVWIYIPIDHGDSIAEIWERSRRLDRELALTFITSQGRFCLFGLQQRESWGACTWTLLDRPGKKPTTIWHNEAGYDFAFETPGPPQQSPPLLPETPSSFPESSSLQNYFYSSAMLDNVAEVAPCRLLQKKKVSGLLFRYSDGREACDGEIRLDCVGRFVQLSKLMKLWMEFGYGDRGVFVRTVQFSRPPKGSTSQWLEVPMRGLLEWWFTWDQCKIYHGGRTSPVTKL